MMDSKYFLDFLDEHDIPQATGFLWDRILKWMDNDDRDDDWPEDFATYMTETGWLSEEER